MASRQIRSAVPLFAELASTTDARSSSDRNAELYKLAVRATNDIVWDLDFETNGLAWSAALFSNFGYAPGEVGPTLDWWEEQIHPDDRERVVTDFDKVIQSDGELFSSEYRFRKADGSYAWVLDRGFLVRDVEGRPVRGVGAIQDQTARKMSEEAVAQVETLNRNIIEANPDCVSVLDRNGVVMFSNRAAARAYGLNSDESLVGRPWGDQLNAKTRKEMVKALAMASRGELGSLVIQLPDALGQTRWFESIVSAVEDAEGSVSRYIVMSRDITSHKAAELQIRWTANHDALTQLPNRLLFQQILDESIERATPFALLLIDVDDFKQVNDSLGHDVGDQMLCAIAQRLTGAVRKDDIVARLGGDEFAILLRGVSASKQIEQISGEIVEKLKEPWIHSGRVLDCRATIGASIYGRHGQNALDLLKNADLALYTAKELGRCRSAIFAPRMRVDVQRRLQMIENARCAIQENLIVPYYQPKLDLTTGETVGWEALLRVQHPSRGLLHPAHVSAALDDIDVAADLGDRMSDLVLADVSAWLKDGLDIGHVAINAGAADFRRGEFAERLFERLERHDVPPKAIQLEVTETVFMGRGAEHVERALASLYARGIRIALDDFGIGYASLSHLRNFPIDVIKIDRSFVRKMNTSVSDAAIVRAVISLGETLGLEVVAEGIECQEEEARLKSKGCRFVQGYFYAKPMPAAKVLTWLKRYKRAA